MNSAFGNCASGLCWLLVICIRFEQVSWILDFLAGFLPAVVWKLWLKAAGGGYWE